MSDQVVSLLHQALAVTPSLVDILRAYERDGNGDTKLLQTILETKRAEDQRLAALSLAFAGHLQAAHMATWCAASSGATSSDDVPDVPALSSTCSSPLGEPDALPELFSPTGSSFATSTTHGLFGSLDHDVDHKPRMVVVDEQGKKMTHEEAMEALRHNLTRRSSNSHHTRTCSPSLSTRSRSGTRERGGTRHRSDSVRSTSSAHREREREQDHCTCRKRRALRSASDDVVTLQSQRAGQDCKRPKREDVADSSNSGLALLLNAATT